MSNNGTLRIGDDEYLQVSEWTTTEASDTSPKDVLAEHTVRLKFHISAGKLTVTTPSFSMVMEATTGRGECLNNSSLECQKASWEGPLPVGIYVAKPEELNDPGLPHGTARNVLQGDWGDWRVRLHPKEGEEFELYGRDNFFIHGGAFSGSAGCIDIGGGWYGNRQTDMLRTIILMSSKPVLVEVVE